MFITDEPTPCNSGANDPEMWFAKEGTRRAANAKALCNTMCPQRAACLSSTLRFEKRNNGEVQPAIFGGFSEAERRSLLKHPSAATVAD